jgi:hypothetical protein
MGNCNQSNKINSEFDEKSDLPDLDAVTILQMQQASVLAKQYITTFELSNDHKKITGIFYTLLNRYTYDEISNACSTPIPDVKILHLSECVLQDVIHYIINIFEDLSGKPISYKNDKNLSLQDFIQTTLVNKLPKSTIDNMVIYINENSDKGYEIILFNRIISKSYDILIYNKSVDPMIPWWNYSDMMNSQILLILNKKILLYELEYQ